VALPLSLTTTVFHHAHMYYSVAIRMYFLTIPVFAWVFTEWCLLAFTPIYLWIIQGAWTACMCVCMCISALYYYKGVCVYACVTLYYTSGSYQVGQCLCMCACVCVCSHDCVPVDHSRRVF
jgi:hypothetical protein